MKRILCFGDSNTWGTKADGSFSHCELDKAYPQILQNNLGGNYYVISEGMPSRTAGCDDVNKIKGNRNGAKFFPQCLISHAPVDVVILFLGTNDLKKKFEKTAEFVANVLEKHYITFARNVLSKEKELSSVPYFIIVCPPQIKKTSLPDYDEQSTKSSMEFDAVLLKLAKKLKCGYVSNKSLMTGQDGIHLTEESHVFLANELAQIISKR